MLLFGQTFCCCTAKAAALSSALSAGDVSGCCCSQEGGCPQPDNPEHCPCKQKRQLADVGVSITIDSAPYLQQHDWFILSAMVPDSVVRIVPAMDRLQQQRRVHWVIPRADRVALSQMLLC